MEETESSSKPVRTKTDQKQQNSESESGNTSKDVRDVFHDEHGLILRGLSL